MYRFGVVVIGRNEGDRLVRCLQSLLDQFSEPASIVYVDSGSTDGSVGVAKSLGINVISLDLSIPFTMARGRNTGFQYLIDNYPDIDFIQFIDGDCELISDWIERALVHLETVPDLAVVCGRRRERFPNESIYNQLADMEWNTPVGDAAACGGDALMRVTAIQQVNGYNPNMICGEEPEMCLRLRQKGWKIRRIDADMTLHDAAILKFTQWWKRSMRYGWSVAEGKAMHGALPAERYMIKQSRSGWLWGLIIPSISLPALWPTHGLSAILLNSYLIMFWRIYHYRKSIGASSYEARLYACFCVISKFPQFVGQLKYKIAQVLNQETKLIEYKIPTSRPIS